MCINISFHTGGGGTPTSFNSFVDKKSNYNYNSSIYKYSYGYVKKTVFTLTKVYHNKACSTASSVFERKPGS